MTSLKQRLQQQAQQASAVDKTDLSVEGAQSREVQLWPKGVYRGRVVEVIEYGIQPQKPFQGQAKPPAEEVQLRIMLFPNARVKQHLGAEVQPLFIRMWPIAVYNSARSKSKQAFDRMNTDGSAKHFREFIGEAFRFKLDVSTANGKEFNRIDLLGTLPAVDEDTGKPLPVPEAPEDRLVLFTFVKPMKEMWDKLHIAGNRPDGTSKNFIQEKIIGAMNFKGSDVERMLQGESAPIIPEAVQSVPVQDSDDELPEPPTDDEDY